MRWLAAEHSCFRGRRILSANLGGSLLDLGFGTCTGIAAHGSVHGSVAQGHVDALHALGDQAGGVGVAVAVHRHTKGENSVAYVVVDLRQYGSALGGKHVVLLLLLKL